MNRKNVIFMTLVISIVLIGSMFSGIAVGPTNTGSLNSLVVEKKVFNGVSWVDEIQANIGDTVQFKITITYYNITDPARAHWAQNITVEDKLPPGLDYIVGSATPEEPTINGNNLTWDLDGVKIYHGQSYVITFNASVEDFGTHINLAEVEAGEYCTGLTLYGSDTAKVTVNTPTPGINVEKYVWDGNCFWVEETSRYPGEKATFKIVVENTGDCNLYNILIVDTLSDSLEYVINSATLNGEPYEPIIEGKNLTWTWNILEPQETLVIIFNATVVGLPCGVDTNWVYVEAEDSCGTIVDDEDSAKVHIKGMCMEKEVWNKDHGAWMESTSASIGDTVRFRITIYYYGSKTLYNIKVVDILPECFSYADNAIPEEPEVSGNTLYWNFSSEYDLTDGEVLTIEFDADVEGGLCDECINWAYVTANECSGRIFEWEDPATVYVECDFTADAGGPYSGEIDEEIQITGSAVDGNPPYLFEWDLDDDGQFDDATGATITHSWSEAGSYIIRLKVTDDDDKIAQDYAAVNIAQGQNHPPNKPKTPSGSSTGKPGITYTYSSNTTDPDGDQVMYLFDWGDGTDSGWLGPYASGATASASHKWISQGSFSVKVKARDHPGLAESVWSDSLPINMPKSKLLLRNSALLRLLYKLIDMFPVLAKILNI